MLADDVSVNFDKRWQIFNILDQLRKFRHRWVRERQIAIQFCSFLSSPPDSQYNFKKNDQILNLFNNFDNYLSEEAVWQLSCQLKPKISKKSPKKI